MNGRKATILAIAALWMTIAILTGDISMGEFGKVINSAFGLIGAWKVGSWASIWANAERSRAGRS